MESKTSLIELFTEELLIFSWSEIKRSGFFHSYVSNNPNIITGSISSNWFRKMSLSIKRGTFFMKKNKILVNSYRFRKQKYQLFFKILIVENAFIRIIEPSFSIFTYYKTLNSTNCLRFL